MTESRRSRQGRPRDPRTQEAILEATRGLLLERGYPALTIDAVAARAGTAKTTIYRRWPGKGALVLDAAAHHIAIGVVPDTGNTRQDLETAVRQLVTTFSDRLVAIVMLAVIASLDEDPTLGQRFLDESVLPWRFSAAAAIERGKARGDFPEDTDVNFVLDVIVGTVFQRTVTYPVLPTLGLERAIVDLVMGTGPRGNRDHPEDGSGGF